MDDLKILWRHTDDLTLELDLLDRPDNIQAVHKQLQDEERRLKKYLPYTYAFIGAMLMALAMLFYQQGIIVGLLGWLGMGSVIIASWCVAYFAQLVRIPFADFAYAQPALDFLYEVQDAIRRKRNAMLVGVGLQSLFLTIGIGLIITSEGGSFDPGHIFGFLGMMLGISGLVVGLTATTFEANYGKVRRVVEEALAEEELDLV